MKRIINIFHYLSYFQYPFFIIGIFYIYKPIIYGKENMWMDFNLSLTFLGIALSFLSLADTNKENRLDKKIFENPKFTKFFFLYLIFLIIIIFIVGLYSMFFTNNEHLHNLSIGILVFGIGIIGLLRMAVEIAKKYSDNIKSKISN